MASNDGQRLLVLGLTFRQHHTLHMQQVLRAYECLPANPMDRVALYTGLFELTKDLDENETRNLEVWLRNGGEFPTPTPRNQQPSGDGEAIDLTSDDDQADENDWPEYHPEDFEAVDMEEDDDDDGDDSTSSEEEGENLTIHNAHGHDQESSEEDGEDDEFEGRRPARPALSSQGKSATECFECLICAESFGVTEFPPSVQITSTCQHSDNERVCTYCLQQSIETAVTEGQLNLITCPFCPEKLSCDDVKKYATNEIFARYFIQHSTPFTPLIFLRYEYLTRITTPDMVMCLGLNCGSGQIHASDNPLMICQTCSYKTCAVHKLPWHEGQTCEEFDMDDSQIERLEEAEATAKLLAKEHAQVCPNCHQGVSRTDGCDHMTCKLPLHLERRQYTY